MIGVAAAIECRNYVANPTRGPTRRSTAQGNAARSRLNVPESPDSHRRNQLETKMLRTVMQLGGIVSARSAQQMQQKRSWRPESNSWRTLGARSSQWGLVRSSSSGGEVIGVTIDPRSSIRRHRGLAGPDRRCDADASQQVTAQERLGTWPADRPRFHRLPRNQVCRVCRVCRVRRAHHLYQG